VAVLQNNVRIEMKKLPDKLFMQVDEEKMYQVFQNLINNAVKYSQTGGKVEIGFDTKNGTNIFIIKDSGMGIPLKQQGRVFEKFFRGDNVTDAGKAGTGLGLYIARAIVEGHGGKLHFESSVKSGTTFYIELPKK
jgi:signal transduction histidine kinase